MKGQTKNEIFFFFAFSEWLVWELTENIVIGSCHLSVKKEVNHQELRKQANEIFHNFNIHSITLQIEENENDSTVCKEHCTKGCRSGIDWCTFLFHIDINSNFFETKKNMKQNGAACNYIKKRDIEKSNIKRRNYKLWSWSDRCTN